MVGADQSVCEAIITRRTSSIFASADFEGVVLPKAESGADVAELAHTTGNLPIHAIVTETAASLFGLISYRDPKSSAGGDELGRRRFVVCARRDVEI